VAIIDCEWWLVRRKLLGTAGASWRGVPTLRMKPSPCLSSRPREARSRAIWQYCSWAWGNVLTDDERATWVTLAETEAWHDFLGAWQDIWAFEWYMACNARCLLAGWPLHKDGSDVSWGQDVVLTAWELVSPTRVSLDWAPYVNENNRVVVFGSGPVSQGRSLPYFYYWEGRRSTPRGMFWIGATEPAAVGPMEFDLPWAVEAGLKLVVWVCGLDYSGMYAEHWWREEVVST